LLQPLVADGVPTLWDLAGEGNAPSAIVMSRTFVSENGADTNAVALPKQPVAGSRRHSSARSPAWCVAYAVACAPRFATGLCNGIIDLYDIG